MKYSVRIVGVGCDSKRCLVYETNNKLLAINIAKDCYNNFDFTEKLFNSVIVYEDDKEVMIIDYSRVKEW